MSTTIKFYYDFLSPYSYLACTQLPALTARHDVTIEYKPIHVLQLMESVGNQPTTVLCKAKLAYAYQDLARWAATYDVPFTPNPHLGSIDSTPLLLGALVANELDVGRQYAESVFSAYWTQQAALENAEELLKILNEAAISNADEIVERRSSKTAQLEDNIGEAIADGVFGVPSFVTEAGLYFGNDRLSFLERALP